MKKNYQKPDFWSKKALSEGYPARSVYKLKEMQKKFMLFSKNAHILDLGAAPGSWTVYVLRYLSEAGSICAVDLKPLDNAIQDQRLTFFQGDMTSYTMMHAIKQKGPFDAVICDAAPATTGNKTVDTFRSASLVEMSLYYAQLQLRKHGNFAVKIFQGGNEKECLLQMRKVFKTVRAFKPEACRSNSFETYLIGLDFTG